MRQSFAAAAFLLLACSDAGQAGPNGVSLAVDRPETRSAGTLAVDSPDFKSGGAIPLVFSAYDRGVSPALSWSGVPAGTKSLALMVEDPDAASIRPFVHWLAWNIDPSAHGLARDSLPEGAVQGRNSRGSIGWFGPRPHGSKPHHYHFQLFALDSPVPLGPSADRKQLLAAMKGHVLAKGDLVGLFAQPGGR